MRWRGGSCGREGNWPAEGAGFGREVRGRETPDSAVGWTCAPLTDCAEVGRDEEGIGSLVFALACCKKSLWAAPDCTSLAPFCAASAVAVVSPAVLAAVLIGATSPVRLAILFKAPSVGPPLLGMSEKLPLRLPDSPSSLSSEERRLRLR